MCVGHEARKGTIRWEAESLKREKVTVYTGGMEVTGQLGRKKGTSQGDRQWDKVIVG